MADGFIQLPTDATGKKLRTIVLPNGDHAEGVVVVDDQGNLVSSPESPKVATLTAVGLASGASVDLDAPAVTTGTIGKLVTVVIAASVPLKAEVRTVLTGTPTTRAVIFTTDARLTEKFKPPHPNWHSLAGGATNFFRVRLTNQDTIDAADVYATIYYDEATT